AEIRADEGNFGQSTITQNTIDQLIEDQLIQQGIRKYFPQDVAKLQPTSQAVGDQLKTFKEGFPAGEPYADFLSKNSLSESDVRTAIALKLRRDLMQQYLAGQIGSPTRQLHLRRIQIQNSADAQKVLDQLKKDSSDKQWGTLAKQNSLDVDTKNVGGDMGWVFRGGTTDAVIELWAFDSARKAGDLSPLLPDVTGTYDVVQI